MLEAKKTVLTNASPCLVKLHLTHSQQDLFAQLCANIVMVLAVSAAPVFFLTLAIAQLQKT